MTQQAKGSSQPGANQNGLGIDMGSAVYQGPAEKAHLNSIEGHDPRLEASNTSLVAKGCAVVGVTYITLRHPRLVAYAASLVGLGVAAKKMWDAAGEDEVVISQIGV